MKPILILITLASICFNSNLVNTLLEIQDALPTVSTDKEILTQELSFDDTYPYYVTLVQATEKVKNGEIETETFMVNLGLLDPNLIEIKTSKKEMKLILKSSEGDFITYSKNNEYKGYKDKVEIFLEDIDLARSLKDKFKMAIDLAHEEWKKDLKLPKDETTITNYIISQIHPVEENGKRIEQTAQPAHSFRDYVHIMITEDDEEKNLYLSLADLDLKKAKMKDGKSSFSVDLSTRDGKKVVAEKGNKIETVFKNKIKIYFDNPSQARAFILALEKGTDQFKEIAEERIENYANCSACLSRLSEIITDTQDPLIGYILSGDCSGKITEKSSKHSKTHSFEWADFDPDGTKLEYKSDGTYIIMVTNGNERFVTSIEDDKTSYGNEIKLLIENVEVAREVYQILPKIINTCDLNVQITDAQFFQNHFNDHNPFEEKYVQSLQKSESESCTMVYTKREDGKGKFQEFKFNLYDIDAASIKAQISKSKLLLEFQSNNKEKVITITSEKEGSKFTDKISMQFGSVKALRIAKETLIAMVKECNKS